MWVCYFVYARLCCLPLDICCFWLGWVVPWLFCGVCVWFWFYFVLIIASCLVIVALVCVLIYLLLVWCLLTIDLVNYIRFTCLIVLFYLYFTCLDIGVCVRLAVRILCCGVVCRYWVLVVLLTCRLLVGCFSCAVLCSFGLICCLLCVLIFGCLSIFVFVCYVVYCWADLTFGVF